ncbi:hypothetical protein KIN20_016891 [Parelaphostrongylus tenuis]|uniref:Peptidase C1A papain C-terminal domain-containing protein n=1 Tax=Parelaphostrongylus tenuis TaxID=148309 RepID=A0AAD5N079_PARTN|nr:hypothetical protein KIN20_016891 [Parelaphostrongylus tenuis]
MKLITVTVIVSLSWAAVPNKTAPVMSMKKEIPPHAKALTGRELVDYVTKNQQLFKIDPKAPIDGLRTKVMKHKFINQKKRPLVEDADVEELEIPESFDARTHWPHCPSLSYIRDQSNCGSCWAVSSAEAMSDRVCIASRGNKIVELSADDILSCCSTCGYGCEGGWPLDAWQYFVESGVVTGGRYGTKNACKPYEIPPCDLYSNCTTIAETPKCERKCQSGYSIPYDKDKSYGKTAYSLSNSTSSIQKDILRHGPVVAVFTVYEDFMRYQSGIYEHTAGGFEGFHAVRMLGWGVENGTAYWLIANSWSTAWGENGYFRIRRGTNECGIEDSVLAGRI